MFILCSNGEAAQKAKNWKFLTANLWMMLILFSSLQSMHIGLLLFTFSHFSSNSLFVAGQSFPSTVEVEMRDQRKITQSYDPCSSW